MTTYTAGTNCHLKLTDGTNSVGLMCCDANSEETMRGWTETPQARFSAKITQGEQRYSDLEPPYNTISQDDWKGGRGLEDFTQDKTRFYDSNAMWSWGKKLHAGPHVQHCYTGLGMDSVPRRRGHSASALSYAVANSTAWIARKITPSVTVTVTSISLPLTLNSAYGATVAAGAGEIHIYSDNAGDPNASLGHVDINQTDSDMVPYHGALNWVTKTFSSPISLTGGTSYWIVLLGTTGEFDWVGEHANPNLESPPTSSAVKTYNNGGSPAVWSALTDFNLFYILNDGGCDLGNPIARICHYRGLHYAFTAPEDGTTAGKIYRNGDRGVVSSAHSHQVIDSSKTWVANEWAGCIVRIVSGTGNYQWRTVVSNTTNGTLEITPDWAVTLDTTSEYVITGSNKWTDVTPSVAGGITHTITKPVTDATEMGDYLYIAMGSAAHVLAYREYNNAGTLTVTCDQAGSDPWFATLLLAKVKTSGARMYRLYQDTSSVWRLDWALYSTFTAFTATSGTAIWTPANGMCTYDDQTYAFGDGMAWSFNEDANKTEALDIQYWSYLGGENGRRPTVWNLFLFFPLAQGLEKMYGKQVDDCGPNRDAGLPEGRQGVIADLCPTVDALYAAIDAGDSGTSSILAYNNLGWHEVVRARATGKRIRNVKMCGIRNGPNMMFFSEGNCIRFFEFPNETSDPTRDSDFWYNTRSTLVTSWIDLGMTAAPKFMHTISLLLENMGEGRQVSVYYQHDSDEDSSTWHFIDDFLTGSGYAWGTWSASLSSTDTLSAYRIRFKFEFLTDDLEESVWMKAWSLETVTRMQNKYSYGGVNVKLYDRQELIDHSIDDHTMAQIKAHLDAWASQATPITLYTALEPTTAKTVFLDAPVYRVVKWEDNSRAAEIWATLNLIEA